MERPPRESASGGLQANLLRTRRYGLFWISSLFSNIGTWMQQVAQPWVVLNISNSSLLVGIDNFAMNAPGWIFTLWGGVLADRYNRRKIILFFQGIQLACVASLVSLLILGWLKVWMIILISFLVGLTDALSMPSFQTIIPSLVNSEEIPRAVALNSTQFNLSRILGPAIAGIMMVKFGAVACFGANAISYIPFFLSLYWIYPKNGMRIKDEPQEVRPLTQIGEFRALLHQNDILIPLLTVLVTTVLCSPLITFSSVLIKDTLHSGAENYGQIMAFFGVGGLVGASFTLISAPKLFDKNKLSKITGLFLGFTVFLVSYTQSLLTVSILFVFAGIMLTISNVTANAFLQRNATHATRGRIASLFQLALHGGMSLGSLLGGLSVSHFGISKVFVFNGVLAILFQAWLLCPRARFKNNT